MKNSNLLRVMIMLTMQNVHSPFRKLHQPWGHRCKVKKKMNMKMKRKMAILKMSTLMLNHLLGRK